MHILNYSYHTQQLALSTPGWWSIRTLLNDASPTMMELPTRVQLQDNLLCFGYTGLVK